ncbi:hypothetical protein [uncultured Dokdonia sp.]|uniref:hypothetical protein n=1 Tax=uncultured Dokdonia sp. TaxID=575653 RepID=UPI00261C21AE|nr:hypothetical protein [uncultured Dokdonia sp.]
MNVPKLLMILSLIIFGSVNAQNTSKLTKKQQERAKVAQDIFSHEEQDRMFFFYEKQMDEMGLKDTARDEYYNMLYYHLYKMKRLDDKDSELTEQAMKAQFERQLALLNADASEMLANDQYEIHLKTWQQLTGTIYAKRGWNK